jgi:N-ethylmaleimide reductase
MVALLSFLVWHQGRTRYTDSALHGPVISASATTIEKSMTGGRGQEPVAMTIDDIEMVKGEYVKAAKNAVLAGFDGVEIQ